MSVLSQKELLNIVDVKNVTIIAQSVENSNGKKLAAEILRLHSLCKTAAQELESLFDLLEENNIHEKKCENLISGLQNKINISYITEYPELLALYDELSASNEN